MKPKQKFLLFSIFLILLFMSLSSVSSATVTFTGVNTTNDIQNIISTTVDDIVLEGEFNNLSTLNINRSIKISGENATISRNTSNSANLILFNVTATNVIIENLKIVGYNTTITSNTSDILIQNNQITSINTAINISSTSDLKNVQIKNNTISTNRGTAYGISLSTNSAKLYDNLISDNTISTNQTNNVGIYLFANGSNLYENTIFNNTITTTGAGSHGIHLGLNDSVLYNNNISANTITVRSAHGVYIFINGTIENNNISKNNITLDVATATNSSGIFLNAQSGNMNKNNIFDNNIKGTVSSTNTGAGARGVDLQVRSGIMIDNTIFYNNVTISSNGSSSYGIFPYAIAGTINNTYIYGNNIDVNCTAIRVGASGGTVNNLNISYNRILTNGVFMTVDGSTGVNNTASTNWFGNNTPDMNKFNNIDVLSYYVVNANAIKSTGFVGENWTINYTFHLNGTNNAGDYNKLPFFQAILFDLSNNQVDERTAYDSGIWKIAIDYPKVDQFTIVLDNEIITFNEAFKSSEAPDENHNNSTKHNDTKDSDDINQNYNHKDFNPGNNTLNKNSSNVETPTDSPNVSAGASTKNTGIGIIPVLLTLIASVGLLTYRRK